jgi:crossover junction endodeoxyribonuclease RuvC
MQQVPNIKERIILGIDPGTSVMGYGLIKEIGPKMELISLGVVKMDKIDDHMLKLQRIFEKPSRLLIIINPIAWLLKPLFMVKTSR